MNALIVIALVTFAGGLLALVADLIDDHNDRAVERVEQRTLRLLPGVYDQERDVS